MFDFGWVRTHLGVVFDDVFGLFWVISWIFGKGEEIIKNLGIFEVHAAAKRSHAAAWPR